MLSDIPGIVGHLMAASFMSEPAAIMIAKIMYFETEQSKTVCKVILESNPQNGKVVETILGMLDGLLSLANTPLADF